MKAPAEIPTENLKAVFTDFDGTLTVGQHLPAAVVDALRSLKASGFYVAIVSGRPAGWADCLTRILPIDAMIFENGAGVCVRQGNEVIARSFAARSERARLEEIFQAANTKFGPLRMASDQAFRRHDFAIDIAEEVEPFSIERREAILAFVRSHAGITAKLSSIHINYWMGTHDKASAVTQLLASLSAPGITLQNSVFCGDSPNDEPLFKLFPYSVGVANISDYLSKMIEKPKFLTKNREGMGFVELSEILLSRGS